MKAIKKLNLFRNSKPVIRKFKGIEGSNAGDMPYVWDAYKKGAFKDVPEGLEMSDFIDFADELAALIVEAWTVEDYINGELRPVALVLCKGTDWLIEPHVIYYDGATPRSIYRTYVAFLKKTKYRKDIGACLVRVGKETTNLTNRVEKMGLLEFVGKIWNGSPTGNEYLYSVRCGRRA